MKFNTEDKRLLLVFSRKTLELIVKEGKQSEEECPNSKFLEKAGLFISLHKGKELRDCIGYIEPVESIWDAIQHNTIAAATQDIRFNPVEEIELAEINIEISILTPPQECKLENIKEKVDGVIIQQDSRKATYLPQVWELINNRDEFFSSLCVKAGLDAKCYLNRRTKFYKYQAIVFSE